MLQVEGLSLANSATLLPAEVTQFLTEANRDYNIIIISYFIVFYINISLVKTLLKFWDCFYLPPMQFYVLFTIPKGKYCI